MKGIVVMSLPKRKKHLKRRIPQLLYTEVRGIGYHVNYRDAHTGQPRKHPFGKVSREDALEAYQNWLADHLKGQTPSKPKRGSKKLVEQITSPKIPAKPVRADGVRGSLVEITSDFVAYEASRIRDDDGPRVRNTITRKQYNSRKQFAHEFLEFLNTRHGQGAVTRMRLADLKMQDVEGFNQLLAEAGYSESQIRKRLQVVKAIIDRAGRPEHGQQVLTWNWDSRDVRHGKPDQPIIIPTLAQLKAVLRKCDTKRTAMVWLAIGCGFGQRDLSALRVGDIDKNGYDLRRGKTGIERYGETPKFVWNCIQKYLSDTPRPDGGLMFLTQRGMPLVHNDSDSVEQWWSKLRKSLREVGEGLNGFYSLRHLGATEFGSRPGCSISAMRGWLGHSISSAVADRYMKPISPQTRPVVEWVRKALQKDHVSLK